MFTSQVTQEEEFYLEKGKKALDAFQNMEISLDLSSRILSMKFDDFKNETDSDIVKVKDVIYRLVSYCDTNAADKALFNEYSDKRTVAKTGIRQNIWVIQLLKWKQRADSAKDSIKNIIAYLRNPIDNFPVASETHKALMSKYYLRRKYDKNSFNRDFKAYMESFVAKCKCDENDTYSIMLYAYSEQDKWNISPHIEGLWTRDTTGWQDDLINDMGDGYGVSWKHQYPSGWFHAKVKQLLKIRLDEEGTFPIYFVENNIATYRATVCDMADEETYDKKVADWNAKNPAWFCNNFKECVGKIFKKLEKVGEPVTEKDRAFQCLKALKTECVGCVFLDSKSCDKDHYIEGPCYDCEIWVEIKQNKEDMEEKKTQHYDCFFDKKKSNLKPFDIQKAREGKPVCTRDGRKARIICFDAKGTHPIIALVSDPDIESEEIPFCYTNDGFYNNPNCESKNDLMMLPEKKEGWVNVYKERVYDTKEEAVKAKYDGATYVDTIKINWEE